MFDSSIPGPDALRELDDAALVSTIQDWARATAAAAARQLAAIAELVRRRCTDEHPDWACDDWDACAAELACALTLGHGRSCGQMDLAITVRDRLPRVGALFLAGAVSTRTVETIARRTELVTDPDALTVLDTEIAEQAVRWSPLSQYKLEQAVDAAVARTDPGAVRRTRATSRDRDFTIGDPHDRDGTTSVGGRLSTSDAALLDQALKALVHSVCDDDPRTLAQRRADAIGALAAHATRLPCRCTNPECPADTGPDEVATRFVIHILADADALTTPTDPAMHGDDPAPPSDPDSPPLARRAVAMIPGMPRGMVPAPLLAELIARGATVRFVGTPDAPPEPRYRPTAALDEFVRSRDLTCRHPGCDRPAVHADIDHTVPWPAGPTHPSNTKCYCRKHHLLKTFWAGWTDRQLPDGTLIVTTPSGHTYTTKPGAALLFLHWNTTTAPLPPPPATPPPAAGRTLMMPTRKQSRAKARAYRIKTERALNSSLVAEYNIPPPF